MAIKTEIMFQSQNKLKKKRLHLPSRPLSEPLKNRSSAATNLTEHNVRLVAQELKFAKLLAGNDARISQNQLKKLEKWLKIRSQSSFGKYTYRRFNCFSKKKSLLIISSVILISLWLVQFLISRVLAKLKIYIFSWSYFLCVAFNEQDFLRLWKGLFYGLWMCDKPLPQEKMADDLAALIHCFDPAVSIQFFASFLKTMNNEWFGIDQWRIDKFMMVKLLNNSFLSAIVKDFCFSSFVA